MVLEKEDLNFNNMYQNVESVKPSGLDLKDRLVGVQRVTKVTKGGRHFSFSAIVVVGDEQNIVGHGLGKANEVTEAISKAIERSATYDCLNYNEKVIAIRSYAEKAINFKDTYYQYKLLFK